MSASVFSDTLSDSASSRVSVQVKRKPPPAGANGHRPVSASAHVSLTQLQAVQQNSQPFHKISFSERYPDPDPTDPFAPLWVLRNRTSSALNREGPPALGHLLQQGDTDEFGTRQADRRRSISYLQTLSASTFSAAEGTHPSHASDQGHGGAPVRTQRSQSIDAATHLGSNGNGNLNFISTLRRQSAKPTPLSQVAVLSTPSVSRGSPSPVVVVAPIETHTRQRPLSADSSGTESDVTRVGLSDVDVTPRVVAQPPYQASHDHEPPHHQQEQSRTRSGSSNKLTRFLKARKASQSGSNSHNVRASITDISRIRKASISPPVFSTVVWAGPGGEFAPIKDHPLQQNAISLITPSIPDVLSPPPPPPNAQNTDAQLGSSLLAATLLPVLASSPIPNSVSTEVLLQPDREPAPQLLVPPPIAIRPSTAPTQAHTEESNSTSSFVHVPTTMSSPSLAQLVASEAEIGPGVSATIASPATMKIKRSSSRPMSKLPPPLGHSTSPSSPLASSGIYSVTGVPGELDPARHSSGEWDIPTPQSLSRAASLPIIAESGVRITFGTLFAQQRVAVVFIRHFWCPLCQDYMTSVTSLTRRLGPEIIAGFGYRSSEDSEPNEKLGVVGDDGLGASGPVKLVVVSNGSYTMIGKYKQIFGSGATALDFYTDPSLAVYTALGMGKDPASLPEHLHSHAHGRSKSTILTSQARLSDSDLLGKSEKSPGKIGGYVKHGLMGGIAMVFVRALKVGLPVWEKGGDLHQLGGEFVFGPGLVCTYAHRMQTTKDHAPFEDVLHAAGVTVPAPLSRSVVQARISRDEKRSEKRENKRSNSLRKPRPSVAISQVTTSAKPRARGRTIDIVPNPTIEIHSAPPVPTSVSTPLLSSPIEDTGDYVPEKTVLHRRRRSAVRSSSVSVTSSIRPLDTNVTAVESRASPKLKKRRESQIERAFASASHVSTIPIPSPTSSAPFPAENYTPSPEESQVEAQWRKDRHRSLQRIKEKKKRSKRIESIRRTADQASRSHSLSPTASLSPSNSLSPSRSIGPVSVSRSPTASSQNRILSHHSRQHHHHQRGSMERERTRSRARQGSTSGVVSESERAVQSDSGMVIIQREWSTRRIHHADEGNENDEVDDDHFMYAGSGMRVTKGSLSRDTLARRGISSNRSEAVAVGVSVEDDAETVSDKTLVHQ
ncbi:hypothetical protein NP233_g5141 [Leucocoprinus birnbaumii]|uniref:Uncharacterized protein n=1 Tax=Leucocoprinus birnbaumii TaxID=56174 RepID=A0AAD5VTF6_9AGAR|nr:hypothetical protein NP233_g5141 [Leucocoprinus birnbaumii]